MDKINDTIIKIVSMDEINKPQRLIAKTGDINGRDLYVQMVGESKEGLNTEGVRLTLAYKTPSGKVGELLFENVDEEEGIFKVTLGEEVTSSAGNVTLAIRVNRDGRLVETPNFDLYVEGSPFVGTIVQPEPEIPSIDEIEYTHEFILDYHEEVLIETDRLYEGEREIIQFPETGEYYIIYGEFYNGDELLKREEVYRIVVKERLDYLIEVGTRDWEEAFRYVDLPDGTVEITGYDGDQKLFSMYIPQQIGGKTVSVIGEGVFEMMDFYEVYIPEGVTTIKDYAFRENIYLFMVEFPESLEYIGNQAFEGTEVRYLATVNIDSNLKYVGNEAFKGSSLSSIDLDGLEYVGDRAFMDNNLEEVVFSYVDVYIGEDAFIGNPERGLEDTLVIYSRRGSNAETYAQENGHQFYGF